MKKLLFAAFGLLAAMTISAQQKVTIKAGTVIPLQNISSLKGGECYEGQIVEFRVVQDINVDGVTVIPTGTIAKGKVFEAKKSSIAGTKGRLGVKVSNIILSSGDIIYLADSEAKVFGKNRTPVAVVAAVFIWPLIFIPGSAAILPEGYQIDASVASNISVTVN